MDKATLLTQFLLNNSITLTPTPLPLLNSPQKLIRAAVLIPIIENNNQLEVILTKRASHLKHHGGQISFPGGKIEKNDSDEIATAIRETHEEIGIPTKNIAIIGTLPTSYTLTGYQITPILGFIKPQSEYYLDKNEVAEIFHVPLNHLLNTNNHIELSIYRHATTHSVYYIPYKQYNIWGATAAILKNLTKQLKS